MNTNTSPAPSAPRVTPADIDAEVVDAQFYVFPGTTVTVCLLMLLNGFTVTGESACVSPENFDAELGRKIALDNAKSKLWQLLGFRLRDKLHALTKGVSQVEAPPIPAKVVGKSGSVLLAAARAAHEVNRAYCLGIGDVSQPPWDAAPAWQRDSAIDGVKQLLANPHMTPADLHENWCRHKVADGWVYGATKDADAKTHPCLVPYDELPEKQRSKDYLFRAAVLNAAAAAGWVAPRLAADVEVAVPVEAVADPDAPIPTAGRLAGENADPGALAAATGRPGRAEEFIDERRRRHADAAPNDARPDTNAMVGSTHIDHTPKQEP